MIIASEYLSTSEAVEHCKKNGVDVTRQGIIYIAQSHGFLHKGKGKQNLFHVSDINEWIKVKKESATVDSDFISCKECAKHLGCETHVLYRLARQGLIEKKLFSMTYSKVFINKKQAEIVYKNWINGELRGKRGRKRGTK